MPQTVGEPPKVRPLKESEIKKWKARRELVKMLTAQIDALQVSMDGPVGTNSRVRGHNVSQYNTDEPGICIFHLPGHTKSCANGSQLSLCGD